VGQLLESLQEFYARAEWPMVQVPGQPILSATYQGTNGQWVFVAAPHEDLRVVTLFCRAPLESPKDRYEDVTVFLERINFGLTVGAWVLDREDGEIRFRVSVDASEAPPSDARIQRASLLCVTAMDSMLPTLRSLIEDGLTAKEAMERLFPSVG